MSVVSSKVHKVLKVTLKEQGFSLKSGKDKKRLKKYIQMFLEEAGCVGTFTARPLAKVKGSPNQCKKVTLTSTLLSYGVELRVQIGGKGDCYLVVLTHQKDLDVYTLRRRLASGEDKERKRHHHKPDTREESLSESQEVISVQTKTDDLPEGSQGFGSETELYTKPEDVIRGFCDDSDDIYLALLSLYERSYGGVIATKEITEMFRKEFGFKGHSRGFGTIPWALENRGYLERIEDTWPRLYSLTCRALSFIGVSDEELRKSDQEALHEATMKELLHELQCRSE